MLARLLATAIAQLREALDDPFARVGVLAPSPTSCALAQRSLAEAGAFVQVRFLEPEGLLRELGEPPLILEGRRPEPPGWLVAAVLHAARALAADVSEYASALEHPRWAPAFAAAIERLEGAGVDGGALRARGRADPERTRLLAALLERVAAARAEAGLYGRADVYRAALEVDVERASRAVTRDRAYVVLGERALAPLAFDALSRWLRQRPGVYVALDPGPEAPAALTGLRRAAAECPPLRGRAASAGALAQLQARLFAAPAARSAAAAAAQRPRAAATADARDEEPSAAPRGMGGASPAEASVREAGPFAEVEMVQALDERREAREAVRAVLDAIRAGAALDRVAVALPSAAQVDVLTAELERARVPYVALLGPPLARAPAAGLLLDLAGARAEALDLPALHHLLLHPELDPTAVGLASRRGRARWRRLLSQVGAVAGLSATRRGLEALELEAEGDIEARRALLLALDAVERAIASVEGPAPWSEHLRRWRALAATWLRESRDRDRLLELLDGPPPSAGDPELDPDDARALLARQLEERAVLSGDLQDPAVRVVPPFELFALDADVVIVTGLADGVFPARPREDPVLSDLLISELDARLEGARVREDLERRRFAAAVGAARRRLVLSAPRSELMSGRPLAPGRLLLDAARALGWASSYRELADAMTPADTDAAGTTFDPERATHEAEQRLARLRRDPERLDGLGPSARGLLALYRAQDRHRAAGGVDRPCPHTGRVDPEILPAPLAEGAPVTPRALARMLEAPSLYFFQELLGARAPRRLPRPLDPFERHGLWARVVEGLRAACREGAAAPLEALEAWLEATRGALPERAAAVAARTDAHGLRAVAGALERAGRVEERELDLWGTKLEVPSGIRAGGDLARVFPSAKPPKKASEKVDRAGALELLARGGDLERLRVIGLRDSQQGTYTQAELEPLARRWLAVARALAEAGYWPLAQRTTAFGGRPTMTRFALAGDPVHDPLGEPEVGALLTDAPGPTEDNR
jgi:hypothetical protein